MPDGGENRKGLVPQLLLDRARAMRHEPAPAEQKLWSCLRARQLGGFKFRRQHPLGAFIADFFCFEARLVIEVDGDSHAEREEYDAARTKAIEKDGYLVIRFLNPDVSRHLDAILEEILRACESRSAVVKSPSP